MMKTNMHSYEVIAHREVYPEGTWWVFSIPALDAVGQATRLADVAAEARGIISAWNESEPAPHDVRVTVRLDGEAGARAVQDARRRGVGGGAGRGLAGT